ncbi:MAG: hypothetical protein QM820_02865 [Minicystis sp.]
MTAPVAVTDSIEQGAWRRRRAVARIRGVLGPAHEAEIEHAHAPVVPDHGVVGLEIAVHEALLVGREEAPPGLRIDLDHLAVRAWARGPPRAEGLPGDELHRDEDLTVGDADLVDRDHVGVRELGERLRLPEEAGVRLRAGARRSQELERDLAIELLVVGGIHGPHPAGAEPVEEREAPDPHGRERLAEEARADLVPLSALLPAREQIGRVAERRRGEVVRPAAAALVASPFLHGRPAPR